MTVQAPENRLVETTATEQHIFHIRHWTGHHWFVSAVNIGVHWLYACTCNTDHQDGLRCEHVQQVQTELARRVEARLPGTRCTACDGKGSVPRPMTSRRGHAICRTCNGRGRVPDPVVSA